MKRHYVKLAAVLMLAAAWNHRVQAADGLVLDDFEKGASAWKFIGGEEFPSAKGSLSVETSTVHGGTRSARVEADFIGGGAYVGIWNEPTSLKGTEFKEIHLWVKTANVKRLGFRITDSSDQCHQKNGVVLSGSTD